MKYRTLHYLYIT